MEGSWNEVQRERHLAAHERLVGLVEELTPDDLRREILYVYNEENDGRNTTTIHSLLKTHVRHQSGHRYQIRLLRGTYSRAHGTDKACFDPW